LGIVNDNYSFCRYYKEELSELLNIGKENIDEFFLITYSSLQKILEGGFKSLESKSLIMWNKTVHITVIDSCGEHEYREATDREKRVILKCERRILDKMEYKDKRMVMITNRWEEFNKKVHSLLHEETNIKFYCKAYKVVFSDDVLKERKELTFKLTEEERTEEKNQLNGKTVSQLHDNAVKRVYKETGGRKSFGGQPKNIRWDKKYVEKVDRLIHILIEKTTRSVRNELKEIKETKRNTGLKCN
jgi:hypothetical protein